MRLIEQRTVAIPTRLIQRWRRGGKRAFLSTSSHAPPVSFLGDFDACLFGGLVCAFAKKEPFVRTLMPGDSFRSKRDLGKRSQQLDIAAHYGEDLGRIFAQTCIFLQQGHAGMPYAWFANVSGCAEVVAAMEARAAIAATQLAPSMLATPNE